MGVSKRQSLLGHGYAPTLNERYQHLLHSAGSAAGGALH